MEKGPRDGSSAMTGRLRDGGAAPPLPRGAAPLPWRRNARAAAEAFPSASCADVPRGGSLVGENLSPYPIMPIAAIARNSTSSADFSRIIRNFSPIAPGSASRPAIPNATAIAMYGWIITPKLYQTIGVRRIKNMEIV